MRTIDVNPGDKQAVQGGATVDRVDLPQRANEQARTNE